MGCGLSKTEYDYYHTRGYNNAKAYRSAKEVDARRQQQRSREHDATRRRAENVARINAQRKKEWKTYNDHRVMGHDGHYYF